MDRCTEGRRQLLAILQRSTRAKVARLIGRCRAAVGFWASGEKLPEYASRKVMEEKLGIPMGAWDQEAVEVAALPLPLARTLAPAAPATLQLATCA
jgi:hypothetical protein